MNILVTGANGQLGSWIRNLAGGRDDRFIFTDVEELDICSASAVREMVLREKVDAIINCAAFTDVDGAEDHAELAETLNAVAPRLLAEAIKERDGLLVHISTDYVFGGDVLNTPIREDRTPAPTSVYGATKLRGEQGIAATGCKYLIIRTAWLYSEYGRNFVKTILRLSAERPSLKVVCDQVGTPTYAHDLAAAILDIVCGRRFEGRCGIYNYTDDGVCSWYDFARAIVTGAGRAGCEISSCLSSEFPSKVRRPAYSVLDKSLIQKTFGVSVPYWSDSLKECLANLESK